jgi:hypothetical protein
LEFELGVELELMAVGGMLYIILVKYNEMGIEANGW